MITKTAKEIYEQHIQSPPAVERLRLLELTAHGLASAVARDISHSRSLLQLEGLGEEIWQGIDAQDYVNELRKEWNQHPS